MKFEDSTDAAAKMVRHMDERDDQANEVEYSERRVKIAITGMREELAAIGAAQALIYRALQAILVLLVIVAVELGVGLAQ